MPISTRTKLHLDVGLADKQSSLEVSAAIDANSARKATTVAAIAVPGSATTTDVANKINEVIAALKAANLMS